MRPTSRGKLWTSLGNRAGEEEQGPGLCRILYPGRYRPSGGLDLNFFDGLSPRWAVANLYGLVATKILTQDILDRGAHLLLEPEGHIPGIIFRALEDQLVVDRQEEMDARAGIRG